MTTFLPHDVCSVFGPILVVTAHTIQPNPIRSSTLLSPDRSLVYIPLDDAGVTIRVTSALLHWCNGRLLLIKVWCGYAVLTVSRCLVQGFEPSYQIQRTQKFQSGLRYNYGTGYRRAEACPRGRGLSCDNIIYSCGSFSLWRLSSPGGGSRNANTKCTCTRCKVP